jgi:hypothetical protein
MKTIAIHQPNYLPWRGYFHKIAHCDVFVFLNDVEFTKRSYTRRVKIRKSKHSEATTYLIVPLLKHSDYTKINALKIDHTQNWQKKQLNQISNTYTGAPGFKHIFPIIEGWMDASIHFEFLSDWNEFLIKEITGLLGLTTSFIRADELPIKAKAPKLNVMILQYLQGEAYLSGQGGKKYQREEDFTSVNIQLMYSDFQDPPYPQAQGEWLGGLSIIDFLMNKVH